MKPLYALTFFLMTLVVPTHAQKVYNTVMDNALHVANSPASPFTQVQIAHFKRDALLYLKKKAAEVNGTPTGQFLDTQAFFLSEFLTLFFKETVKMKRLDEDKWKQRKQLFTDASLKHPLTDDPDTQTTMAYVTREDGITPFCLNTDWEKAYLSVKY
ncbi:MAG: hypothetical protein ACI3YD_04165 [Alloprevotella sp.]